MIIADATLAVLQGCLRPAEDTHRSQNDTIRDSVETVAADKKVTICQATHKPAQGRRGYHYPISQMRKSRLTAYTICPDQ